MIVVVGLKTVFLFFHLTINGFRIKLGRYRVPLSGFLLTGVPLSAYKQAHRILSDFFLTVVRYIWYSGMKISWFPHRPQIAAVRFPGTVEGFLATGPHLESCQSQLSFWVPVAPIALFA